MTYKKVYSMRDMAFAIGDESLSKFEKQNSQNANFETDNSPNYLGYGVGAAGLTGAGVIGAGAIRGNYDYNNQLYDQTGQVDEQQFARKLKKNPKDASGFRGSRARARAGSINTGLKDMGRDVQREVEDVQRRAGDAVNKGRKFWKRSRQDIDTVLGRNNMREGGRDLADQLSNRKGFMKNGDLTAGAKRARRGLKLLGGAGAVGAAGLAGAGYLATRGNNE